jgi:hypothetical protein
MGNKQQPEPGDQQRAGAAGRQKTGRRHRVGRAEKRRLLRASRRPKSLRRLQASLPAKGRRIRADAPDPLLTCQEVARWLSTSDDWVWDHLGRRTPYLPVIWLSDGSPRFKRSKIIEFIDERERLSPLLRKRKRR